MNAPGHDLTVYYDGACPLCTAEINHYRGCRGADAIAFVDVAAAPSAAEIGPGLRCDAALARFHVRDRDGTLYDGAAAFARLWRALPGWRWLGRIAGVRVVLPLSEAAYRVFLPLRPTIVRLFTRWQLRVGTTR